MDLREAVLELLTDHGLRPGRATRVALGELLGELAAANPDLPPPGPDDEAGDDEPGLATRSIACPHCGEPVVVELELDGGAQSAIQDCAVCCRPIALAWSVADGGLDRFDVGPA